MVEKLDLTGFCPSVDDDRVHPEWSDSEDTFVCPSCGVILGDNEDDAHINAQNHFVKVER